MTRSLNTLSLVSLLACASSPQVFADAGVLSLNCNGCHGPNGVSVGQSIPSIAGLEVRYFMRTMLRFRKGERNSTIMRRIADGYRIRELRQISEYFASLEWENTTFDIDSRLVTRGREIHEELCEECHEHNGRHQDKDIPRISGQTVDYLYLQMIDYHSGIQPMPQPDKMKERIETLNVTDLKALSQFYASGS